MFRRFLAVSLLLVSAAGRPAAADDDPLAEPIRKGREYLLKAIEAEKSVGVNAIAVVALQTTINPKDAGKPQDARVAKVIEKLHETVDRNPTAFDRVEGSHYALAYALIALVNDGAEKHDRQIKALARVIVTRQLDCGGWGYPNQTEADTSQTHHMLAALAKAGKSGADVPLSVWEKAMLFHLRTQDARGSNGPGGFGYHPIVPKDDDRKDQQETATMSISGYCSMLLCRKHLEGAKQAAAASPLGPPVGEAGKEKGISISKERMNKAIDEAENWVVHANPYDGVFNSGSRLYYFLATLERGAALRGKDSPFQKVAWHQSGAERILRKQREDGSFKGGEYDGADTSMALMFLGRAAERESRPQFVEASRAGRPAVATAAPPRN